MTNLMFGWYTSGRSRLSTAPVRTQDSLPAEVAEAADGCRVDRCIAMQLEGYRRLIEFGLRTASAAPEGPAR